MATIAQQRPAKHRSSGQTLSGRQMELVASVSRSSGLDKDGDTLKNHKIQEEYWQFVQTKVSEHWKRYPLDSPVSKSQEDAKMNVLICIRKLREGVMASKRTDQFALEVYELSLRISAIFESPVQTTATLSYLLPNFYLEAGPSTRNLRSSSVVIALLHQLLSNPSHISFRHQLHTFPASLLPSDSSLYLWISSLALAIRSCNYAKVELLSRRSSFLPLLDDFARSFDQEGVNLSAAAVCVLVDSLGNKLRPRSWLVIHTAYREFNCTSDSTTANWLSRSLILNQSHDGAEGWLRSKSKDGDVKPKEDAEGKWTICKP